MANRIAFAILVGAGLLHAQESIHISPTQDQSASTEGGPGTSDPEHYSAHGYSMRALLCLAYVIGDCQTQIAGDAGLLDSNRYNVEAKMPPGASREQFHILLQSALKSRIQDEGYNLGVGNDEPKLTVQPASFSKAHGGALVAAITAVVLLCLVVGYLAVAQLRRRPVIPATPS